MVRNVPVRQNQMYLEVPDDLGLVLIFLTVRTDLHPEGLDDPDPDPPNQMCRVVLDGPGLGL